MRRGALLLAATALVGVAPAAAAPPPAKLVGLRVCPATSFSRALGFCTRDESGTTIVSNRISCSVHAIVADRAILRGELRYGGELAYSRLPVTLHAGLSHWWMNEDIGVDAPLPGGKWSCAFRLGAARATGSFTSGGPTGDVVDTAACAGTHVVTTGGGSACLRDESGAPIAAPPSVLCSGVFLHQVGKLVEIQIWRAGAFAVTDNGVSRSALWILQASLGEPSSGPYSCRYLVDGRLVLERHFTVGPPP